jgi:N6-adenosine-specific RNA methylase IME4
MNKSQFEGIGMLEGLVDYKGSTPGRLKGRGKDSPIILPLPAQKYNIIYADPPWKYDDGMNAGKRGAIHKYPVMSDKEILEMPVLSIAADNCALLLWATFPRYGLALEVIKAWGFAYKSAAFVWVKTNRVKGNLFMGNGNFTRANAEVCLLGIRGKMQRLDKSVHQVVKAPRQEHSRKPDEVRERILKLFGDIPRIELFARRPVDGWEVWGNEVCDITAANPSTRRKGSAVLTRNKAKGRGA